MSKKSFAVAASLIVGSALSVGAQSQSGFNLYGVTFFNNEFVQIDPSTGQGTLVGSLGANVSPFGIASRNGSLYTFNPNSSQIQQVNPATGQAGAGINIGISGVQGEGDLTFSPNGTGFLFAALDRNFNVINNLYTFDITSGTSTRVGSSGQTLDGLAFVGNLLYATAQGDSNLYLVNQSNGSLFPVGSLGVDPNSPFQGLTAAPDGGLFAAINDRLYRLNPFTGAATEVNANIPDIGYSSVSGLVTTAVPEPGVYSLFILGVGSFLWLRPRIRAGR